MKKLILTGCAAALFCIGSIAQVQDTVNNNLRQGAQETEQETKDAGNELRQGAEQTGDQIEQTADSAKQDAEQAGNEIKQETQEAGNEVQQGAERTGEQMEQATDSAKQDAERTGNEIQQGVDRTKDQMDSSSQSSPSSNATDMGASAQPPMQEIEVLEDKEGPDNQVIYKYQGEFYYVDREQKQLVKIEESQLKDAEDKAIEHNATMSGNEPAKSEQDKQ